MVEPKMHKSANKGTEENTAQPQPQQPPKKQQENKLTPTEQRYWDMVLAVPCTPLQDAAIFTVGNKLVMLPLDDVGRHMGMSMSISPSLQLKIAEAMEKMTEEAEENPKEE